MTTSQVLLDQYNQLRNLKYPDVGYSYYADIKGDGRDIKVIYTIISELGGVVRSDMNDISPRKRCENIRKAIHNLQD